MKTFGVGKILGIGILVTVLVIMVTGKQLSFSCGVATGVLLSVGVIIYMLEGSSTDEILK